MIQKALKKNRTYLFMLLALTILAALVSGLFFTPYFISNDDLLLKNLMSGTYTGTPEAHLIYVMFPLGLIFKAFYSIAPGVRWYEIFTFGMHFVCIFLILARMDYSIFGIRLELPEGYREKEGFRYLRPILLTSVFLLFWGISLPYIIANQYTLLAGEIIAVSVIYFATCDLCQSKKEFILSTVACACTFALSLWLRKEVCFMILPVYALLFIIRLVSKLKFKKSIKELMIISGILFAILVASVISHKIAYSSPEWKEFEAFNKARTDVYDYGLMPGYQDNKEFYLGLGIGEDEYTAMIEYTLSLVPAANTANFETMAVKQKAVLKEWEQYYNVPSKIVKDTLQSLGQIFQTTVGIIAIAVFLLTVVNFFLIAKRNKIAGPLLAVIGMILYFLVFTAYFTHLNRLPERVYVPLLYALLAAAGGLMIRILPYQMRPAENIGKEVDNEKVTEKINEGVKENDAEKKLARVNIRKRQTFGAFLFLIAGIAFFAAGVRVAGVYQDFYGAKEEIFDEINAYISSNPDKVFFVTQSVYATQCKALFKGNDDPENSVRMVDWTYQSPVMRQKFKHLGLEDNPETVTKDNVRVIMADFVHPEYVVRILNKNGINADVELDNQVQAGNTTAVIWRF